MDTNYLLHREQVSLMMADRAASAEARIAHASMAKGYGVALIAMGFPHRRAPIAVVDRDLSKNPDLGAAAA